MRITLAILATMLSLCTNPAVSFGDTDDGDARILIPGILLTGVTFTAIAGNAGDLISGTPSAGGGWFGIVAGTMTAAFAISVSQSDSDLKGVSTAGIVLGALAAGLGTANLYLARRGDGAAARSDRIVLEAILRGTGGQPAPGIALHVRF